MLRSVMLLFCILSITACGAAAPEGHGLVSSPTPAPTYTAYPTYTPYPTATKSPTRLPITTAIAIVDELLAATQTAELTLAGYGQAMQRHMLNLTGCLSEFARLMTEAEIGDALWRNKVEVELMMIRGYADRVREMWPPEEMREVHELVIAAMDDYEAMTDHVTVGLDEMDPAEIQRATDLMHSGSAKLREATALVQEKLGD